MDKKVYICTNEDTNYSRAILLTEEQAKAINWFLDNIVECSGDYSCCLPEACADEIW